MNAEVSGLSRHTIKVWGEPFEIDVSQDPKGGWIAIGEYRGERIQVRGDSAGSAISLWRNVAEYQGRTDPA